MAIPLLKSPLSAQFELTNECDNACRHCYNSWRPDAHITRHSLSMPDPQLYAIANEIINHELIHVVLTGGEPLLRGYQVVELAQRFTDAGLDLSLNSDLKQLTDDLASALYGAGIKSTLTSIIHHKPQIHDSVTQVNGSLEATLRGIQTARQAGINVSANMVVYHETVNDIYDVGKFLIENYNIKGFCATRVNASKPAIIQGVNRLDRSDIAIVLDSLIRLQQEFGLEVNTLNPIPHCFGNDWLKYDAIFRKACGAGKIFVGIAANGDVKACHHSDIVEGNLLQEPLTMIWQRMDQWRTDAILPNQCQDCPETPQCRGGCREYAKNVFGRIDGPDPMMGKEIPVREESLPALNILEGLYVFLRPLRIRREDFGALLIKSKSNFMMIDKVGLDCVMAYVNAPFTVADVANYTQTELPTANRFMNQLHYHKMIKPYLKF